MLSQKVNILKNVILRKRILQCIIVALLLTSHNHTAQAVKILATINSAIVTDYDVAEFSKILCLLENKNKSANKACNQQEMFSLSLMTLIEENLKSEHIKRLELPPDAISANDFEKYKQQVIGGIKLNKIDRNMLDWYIKTEFIWQMIIGSQLREMKISNEEIENYATSNKIKLDGKTEKMIENILMQQKANEISHTLMEKMKKFYLIDIRV